MGVGALYSGCAGDLSRLQEVFEEVKCCVPSGNPEEITIHISWREDEEGGYFDVVGFVCGSSRPYTLELYPFEEWTGFFLEERLLEKMPAPEAASHILLEMTFFGFSDSAIAAARKELEDEIGECAERPERCVPLHQAFKRPGAKRPESN